MKDKLGEPGKIAKDTCGAKEGLIEIRVRFLEVCLPEISVAFASDVLLTSCRCLEHALDSVEKKLSEKFQLRDALLIRTKHFR